MTWVYLWCSFVFNWNIHALKDRTILYLTYVLLFLKWTKLQETTFQFFKIWNLGFENHLSWIVYVKNEAFPQKNVLENCELTSSFLQRREIFTNSIVLQWAVPLDGWRKIIFNIKQTKMSSLWFPPHLWKATSSNGSLSNISYEIQIFLVRHVNIW